MQIQAVTLCFAMSTLCVFTDKGVAAGGVQWLSGKSYQDYCSGSTARQGATQHVCFSGKEVAEFSDSSHFTGILSGNKRDFVVLPDGARTALIATKNQGGPISIVWGQGNKARCASVDAPGQGEGHYDICQPGGKTIQLS